jgi:hypothetical protein
MKLLEIRKFVQVLQDAQLVATAATAKMEDGGTCNFDAPAIRDLRVTKAFEESLNNAGFPFFKAKYHGVVLGFSTRGQAAVRTKAAEVFTKYLKEQGYNAHVYYQVD